MNAAGFNSDAVQKNQLKINSLLAGKNHHILIHPFSMIQNKSLSPVQLFALTNYFKIKFAKQIFIIGGDELTREAELIQQKAGDYVMIKSNESLTTLIELIKNSEIFVAIDSFPIHIADSINSNYFGIFGPTNPASVLINSEKSVFFNTKDLQSIDEQRIINAVDQYLLVSGIK